MVSPPRILLVGLVTIFTFFYGIVELIYPGATFLKFSFYTWWPIFILVVLAFLFSIPREFYSVKTLKAIFTLPKAFLLMFASLFKLKGANKKFIHTEHGTNTN
jgi:hypothetical protein